MADALADKTVPELRKIAASLDIDGRSNMDHDELVNAIEDKQANPGAAPAEAAKDAVADAEPQEEEESFDLERLINESTDFLGVPSHAAAGAFSAISKKSLTITEAKAAVEAWSESVDKTTVPDS